MTYRIEGSGPQWLESNALAAESAVGALERSHAVRMVYGQAMVFDDSGRRLSPSELMARAEAELA